MSEIWKRIESCSYAMRYKLQLAGNAVEDLKLHNFSWENYIFQGPGFRRSHIEIVDKKQDFGIYILHATVFPSLDSDAPIWGFDVVSGKNKITGAFHDFSITTNENHKMCQWFKNTTTSLSWSKNRTLPPWAEAIFSKDMIAAGNLQDLTEVDKFLDFGLESLSYYLENCKEYSPINDIEIKNRQNNYCVHQKMNPRVIQSMVAMGYSQESITNFVDEILFPEIK